MLEEKLARFGVQGKSSCYQAWPSYYAFEYQPAIDAKVEKL